MESMPFMKDPSNRGRRGKSSVLTVAAGTVGRKRISPRARPGGGRAELPGFGASCAPVIMKKLRGLP